MNTDLILDSLQQRMRALHSLWEDAVATMNLEQVNDVSKTGCPTLSFPFGGLILNLGDIGLR